MVWTFIPDPSRDLSIAGSKVESTPFSYPVTSIYPYKVLEPAKETRLLSIEPGNYDDAILCHLFHAPLHEQHEYEALSYVWGNALPNGVTPDMDAEGYAVVYGDGKKNEPVRKIPFRDLVDYTDYENVYYASGGPRKPGKISIDGHDVDIGGELYTALKRLRSKEEHLTFWVDALCINQTDVVERTEQVRAMSAIYGRAKRVRIWLGEEVGNEEQAFETLTAIAKKFEEMHKKGIDRDMQKLHFHQDETIRDLHWDSLGELLRRSWFRRVWVIQEVANAADAMLQVGTYACSWQSFSSIINTLRWMDADLFLWSSGELTATETVGMMDSLRSTRIHPNPPQPPLLLGILRESRPFKCTMPSDKIYGVLGLASDSSSVSIDYSLSASEVYKRYAISYLRDKNSLDILYCCAKSPRPSTLTLPSWVPDWTQPCHHEPLRFRNYTSAAAGQSPPRFHISDDARTLHILGRGLDSIAAVEELRRIPRSAQSHYEDGLAFFSSRHQAWLHDFARHTRAWFANVLRVAFPRGRCSPAAYEALWRAVVCNRTVDGAVPPPAWARQFVDFLAVNALPEQEYLESLRRRRHDADAAAAAATTAAPPPPRYDLREVTAPALQEDLFVSGWRLARPYALANGMWCYNRRFVRTEAGRFGWVPDGTRVGDEVCILYGGDVPFVLRADGEGGHEVIGDAYLHGFMDGEGMGSGFEEKEFHLV